MRKRLCLVGSILLSVVFVSGCGSGSSNGTPPPAPKAEFLYTIVDSGSPPNISFELSSFKLDTSTGGLTPTSTQPWSQLYPQFVVDPASKFVYASGLGAPGVGIFSVGIFSLDPTTGIPDPDPSFFIPTNICGVGCTPNIDPGYLAVDPNGKYLFYGSASFGLPQPQIGALSVNSSTGTLSMVNGSPFPASQMPFAVLVHPSGKFVYTEDISTAPFALTSVSAFGVDSANGALSQVAGSPFTVGNASPVGFAIDPSGKFLYAATGLAANGVLGWQIDSTTGALSPLPGSPFQPGASTLGAAFDTSGRFFYTSAGAAGGISGFSVDSNTGALTPLSGSPFLSNMVVSAPTFDPSGKFAYSPDFVNKAIAGFGVNSATGALTPLGSSTNLGGHVGSLVIIKAP